MTHTPGCPGAGRRSHAGRFACAAVCIAGRTVVDPGMLGPAALLAPQVAGLLPLAGTLGGRPLRPSAAWVMHTHIFDTIEAYSWLSLHQAAKQ